MNSYLNEIYKHLQLRPFKREVYWWTRRHTRCPQLCRLTLSSNWDNTSLSYPPSLSNSGRNSAVLTDTDKDASDTTPPLPPQRGCIAPHFPTWVQEKLWMEKNHTSSITAREYWQRCLPLILTHFPRWLGGRVKEWRCDGRRRSGRQGGGGWVEEASKG